jgi:60 kDa SS-A/Ro ribonucleoprotein
MSTNFANHFNTKKTPQKQPIPGRTDMVKNNAGGYVFQVDSWNRLNRFLTIGSEGGTYYVGEAQLTLDNAKNVMACISQDGPRVVQATFEVSDAGRAPNNDAAIFVLALAASFGDAATKKAVEEQFNKIIRTGTHLLMFMQFVNNMRGWGRYIRRIVAGWYTQQNVQNLAYQLIKYRNRNGWTHRDVLRVVHAKSGDELYNTLFRWVTHPDFVCPRETPGSFSVKLGNETNSIVTSPDLNVLWAFYAANEPGVSRAKIVELIASYNLPREAIPNEFLGAEDPKNAVVWEALLQKMPMTALIRNLANMTRVGLIKELSAPLRLVEEKLTNVEVIRRARIHPINVLIGLKTYARGQGNRGQNTWKPVQRVVDALDSCFYAAFPNVTPTGKPTLIGLDVSGSMAGWNYFAYGRTRKHGAGTSPLQEILTPREITCAMAMVVARTEPNYAIMAFSHQLVEAKVSPKMRLDEVCRVTAAIPMGGTDCSLPFIYARKNKLDVEVFQTYTDNETWAWTSHPTQELKAYRDKCGKRVRSIVHAVCPTEFTIADPKDTDSIDISGFDSATPAFVADFCRS